MCWMVPGKARVAIHVMRVTDREAGKSVNISLESTKVNTENYVRLPQRAAMSRTLVWIEEQHFRHSGRVDLVPVDLASSDLPTKRSCCDLLRFGGSAE